MTNHEINLALARFVGLEEQPSDQNPIPRGAFVVGQDPGFEPTIWRGLFPASTHEPWTPLSNSAQAVEVMAEVARRGGRVETMIQYGTPPFTLAHAYLRHAEGHKRLLHGEGAGEHASPAISWCRAVCLAILAAIGAAP